VPCTPTAYCDAGVCKSRITEFPVPTTGVTLNYICVGGDGNLWFTEARKIGRITPSGEVTEFLVPSGGAPSGIALGPDANVWFTETDSPLVGRITPTGVVTEFPTGASVHTNFITAGPDGNLWFTQTLGSDVSGSNTIVAMTIAGNIAAAHTLSAPDALGLGEITGQAVDGNL
jgi:virginiamycin B lyase